MSESETDPARDATDEISPSDVGAQPPCETETSGELSSLLRDSVAPTHIGPYRLVQRIGTGGMGEVYKAERRDPMKQVVALKLIKLGMDTREVIARFESERQALALMNHPNIARVFDAGVTDAGRPYFVMEFVPGEPITDYCDRHKLTTRERLELLCQACRAVQHAHQKAVIHRDLKPGNVLVMEQEGRPLVKVIDFGVAKALSQRLTERTLFTARGQLLGTPEYMSPEQAQAGIQDVDTRGDLYSLGVLLYELLTGTTPFDPKVLRSKAYDEIQRIIREIEPPCPSTRLSSLGAELSNVARRRQTEPAKLGRLVRGDLDWIVMKCLEKDRARRYDTANALAQDVARHLKGEPVSAGPPTAVYRLRKFVRRHRVGLAATAAVVVSLAMLLAGAVYYGFRDVRQKRRHILALQAEQAKTQLEKERAEQQKSEADDARMQAEAINGLVWTIFTDPRVFTPPGAEPADTLMLRRLAKRLDEGALKSQPKTEAVVRTSLGQAYRRVRLYPQAEAQLREALKIRTRVYKGDHEDVAASWTELGTLLHFKRDHNGAEEAHRTALRMRRELHGKEHPSTAESLNCLGAALFAKGDYAEAEKAIWEGLQIRRMRGSGYKFEAAESRMQLGSVLLAKAYAGDEKQHSEAFDGWSKAMLDVFPSRGMAAILDDLGDVLQSKGEPGSAQKAHQEAALMAREILQDELQELEKSLARMTNDASVLAARGQALARLGRFEDALRDYDRAIELGKVNPLDPSKHSWWYERACLRLYLGDDRLYRAECRLMLDRFGKTRHPTIADHLVKACLLTSKPAGDLPALASLLDNVWPSSILLAQTRGLLRYRAGDFPGAIEWFRKIQPKSADSHGPTADFYLAMAQHRVGREYDARRTLKRAIESIEKPIYRPGEGDLGFAGLDNWLICQIARREAEALMVDDNSPHPTLRIRG
jgi:serine/threonine protein kinase/tetratricopeptide (TPR) repeat protein